MKFDSKLNLNLNEGEERLRVVISAITFIGAYILFVANGNSDNILVYLLLFPILSILIADVAYILVTVVYWVVDGFKKNDIKSSANLKKVDLFKVAYDGSHILLQKMINSVIMAQGAPADELMKQIVNSWQQPSLVYSYALTCICMCKNEPAFMKSEEKKKLHKQVVQKLVLLDEEERVKYSKDTEPNSKLNLTNAANDLKKSLDGIIFFMEQVSSPDDTNSPLYLLNKEFSTITGLNSEEQLKEIDVTGKLILAKINKQINA